MNFLKKLKQKIAAFFTYSAASAQSPHIAVDDYYLPVSDQVVHHTHNPSFLAGEELTFEEDYVEPPVRKKPGPKSRFASEEEKKAYYREYRRQQHKKRYADPAYRQQKVDYMRNKRHPDGSPSRGWTKRNLGISSVKDKKAYEQAYHLQTKATGNTATTFRK